MVLLTSDDRDTYLRPSPPIRHHNQNHNNPVMASSVDPGVSRGGGNSSSLSNFTSLPCFNIKWGRQKQLRCVKDSDNDHHNELSNSLTRSEFNSVKRRRSSSSDNDDGGIQAMREKLMLDFRRQAAQMQAVLLNKSDAVSTVPPSPEVEPPPWNLRTRRAVCKGPTNNNNNNINNNVSLSSERKPSFSPVKITDVKSPAKRNDADVSGAGGGGGGGGDEGQRAKFTRSLSKQEIEEDFLAMIGARPVRRPKKRPRIVQRQIDVITPGYWLSEITADMYKVNEHP